jgi:serine/threonine protein phosphatase PrpC
MIDFIKRTMNDKARTNTVSESLVYKAQESGSLDNISAIFVSLKNIKNFEQLSKN